MLNDDEIIALIKGRLTPKRFIHSLEVAKEAKRLALKYGENGDRLYTAGLLHDIMKDTSPEQQLKFLIESGIMLSDIEFAAFKLWHAISGAEYARREVGVTDEEILSAIRYHTTAKAGMTVFEKLLYIADFTSADRNYPGVEGVRQAAEESIEAAMEEGLAFTVSDLAEARKAIHPDTLAAYNEIVSRKKS